MPLSILTQNSISFQPSSIMTVQLHPRTRKSCDSILFLTQRQAADRSSISPHFMLMARIYEAMMLHWMLLVRLGLVFNAYESAETAIDQALLDEPEASTQRQGHTGEQSFGERQSHALHTTRSSSPSLSCLLINVPLIGTGPRLSLRQ